MASTLNGWPIEQAAQLSYVAYSENVSGSVQAQLGATWTVLSVAPQGGADGLGIPTEGSFDSTDYYVNENAAAVVAQQGDLLVIAIRGADGPLFIDIPPPERAVDFADASYSPLDHYHDLLPLFELAINYANTHADVDRILVTGHSLGGQAAELFAAHGGAAIDLSEPINLGKFDLGDISIITFGSPGIPDSEVLFPIWNNRVVNFYNTEDPVYQIFDSNLSSTETIWQGILAAYLSFFNFFSLGGFSTYAHPGTNIPFTIPNINGGVIGDIFDLVFTPEHEMWAYNNNAHALAVSRFLNDAPTDSHFIFGGTDDEFAGFFSDDLLTVADSDPVTHFLLGLAGNDTLRGGIGNDLLDGGDNDDHLWGGGGDDKADGGFQNDVLLGEAGNDQLWGSHGSDTLVGGSGDDRLVGDESLNLDDIGPNADLLVGGSGSDELIGGKGTDTLDGRNDDDLLRGGAGDDTYRFGIGDGIDVIDEESAGGIEMIELYGQGVITSLSQLNYSLVNSNADLVIYWS